MYCPDCGEDPCVCWEEHSDSDYSDSPDEHEFHENFDYESYDGIPRGRLFPDPDDEEIFF